MVSQFTQKLKETMAEFSKSSDEIESHMENISDEAKKTLEELVILLEKLHKQFLLIVKDFLDDKSLKNIKDERNKEYFFDAVEKKLDSLKPNLENIINKLLHPPATLEEVAYIASLKLKLMSVYIKIFFREKFRNLIRKF